MPIEFFDIDRLCQTFKQKPSVFIKQLFTQERAVINAFIEKEKTKKTLMKSNQDYLNKIQILENEEHLNAYLKEYIQTQKEILYNIEKKRMHYMQKSKEICNKEGSKLFCYKKINGKIPSSFFCTNKNVIFHTGIPYVECKVKRGSNIKERIIKKRKENGVFVAEYSSDPTLSSIFQVLGFSICPYGCYQLMSFINTSRDFAKYKWLVSVIGGSLIAFFVYKSYNALKDSYNAVSDNIQGNNKNIEVSFFATQEEILNSKEKHLYIKQIDFIHQLMKNREEVEKINQEILSIIDNVENAGKNIKDDLANQLETLSKTLSTINEIHQKNLTLVKLKETRLKFIYYISPIIYKNDHDKEETVLFRKAYKEFLLEEEKKEEEKKEEEK